jgi:FkbM family methyltransferase
MRAVFTDDSTEEALKASFFGALREGYFVDVGANDPQRGSQSWQLEQRGWKGVLVEPQPDLAERLRRDRSAHVVAAACSSPGNRDRTMTLRLAGPYSSLNHSLAAPGVRTRDSIEVPVRTLDDILCEAKAPVPIDFISIDVEGHELDVLKGLALERWQPRLILLEDHLADLAAHRYLTAADYRIIRRTGLNSWYVPRAAMPPDGGGRWQLARKLYLSHPFRLLRNWKRRLFGQLQFAAFAMRATRLSSARRACPA